MKTVEEYDDEKNFKQKKKETDQFRKEISNIQRIKLIIMMSSKNSVICTALLLKSSDVLKKGISVVHWESKT